MGAYVVPLSFQYQAPLYNKKIPRATTLKGFLIFKGGYEEEELYEKFACYAFIVTVYYVQDVC